jgi:peptidoglycan hydrolase-like protein with peptidoglycan-binding domain
MTDADSFHWCAPGTCGPHLDDPLPTEAIVNQLPLVMMGQSGPFVGRVQALLVAAGYLRRDGIDNHFGPVTDSAVVAFQKAHGLSPDGKVGTQQTWPALLGV